MSDAQRSVQLLLLQIGSRLYGLRVSDVREVLPSVALTPLPGAPAIVEGVFNLRGQLVAALDMRARFSLPPKPNHPDDVIVVADIGSRLVAFRADHAIDLVDVDLDALEDAEVLAPGVSYVSAIAKLPVGLALIHDPGTFLSTVESTALDDALRASLPPPPQGT